MNIKDYGWDEYFEKEWKQYYALILNKETATEKDYLTHLHPGRIIADYGQSFRVIFDEGEILVSRPVNRNDDAVQPAVGDWVVLEWMQSESEESLMDMESFHINQPASIRYILKRKTKFSRAAAGNEVKEQIIAANADTVFLIQSLNRDFNIRRLERYLIAAWESGALPVVVLTKTDCCDDTAERMAMVYTACPGVAVYAVSSITNEGIEGIRKYFAPGKTVALLGSSGVGKSTLVNTLAGKELLKTRKIREDDSRGRHTTTHRELLLLPGGGVVMDTPGMRTLSLWEADTGMEAMFGDIEQMIKMCRFNDCSHQNEPGCAVREAIETGELESKRWESWQKLQKELAYMEAKKEGKVRLAEKQWGKQISKLQKELYKEKM